MLRESLVSQTTEKGEEVVFGSVAASSINESELTNKLHSLSAEGRLPRLKCHNLHSLSACVCASFSYIHFLSLSLSLLLSS